MQRGHGVWAVGLFLACWGCDRPVAQPGVASGSPGAEQESSSTGDGWEPTPAVPVDDDDGDQDDDAMEPEPGAISSGFITDPDGGIQDYECSLWDQNCPTGEKCNVWANDGGNSWNSTKCVEIDPDPDLAGETCQVEGSGVSGIDSCGKGAFCWDVDAEGNGMCVPYCQGSENNPTCGDPAEAPAAGKEFCICLPTCDPLLNDCPVGCGCYATDARFQCVPDASGPDLGLFGDPCEFTNACDPGFNCTSAEFVECDGAACCSFFCEVGADDQLCPEGYGCTPVYEEGTAGPGFEDIGVCLLQD